MQRLASATASGDRRDASRRSNAGSTAPAAGLREHLLDVADVRREAGENLDQDRAEGEHVAALVEVLELPHRLLRRDVGRRLAAEGGRVAVGVDERDAAELRLRVLRTPLVRDPAVREDRREAPVHDLDLPERPDHDVLRPQVAVDDAARVRVGHRLADLQEDVAHEMTLAFPRGCGAPRGDSRAYAP